MKAKKQTPKYHRKVLSARQSSCEDRVFLDTEDLSLDYFLGKIPLTSQKGSEREENL